MTPTSSPRMGSWSWILQAVTGVLLLALLGLHMIGNHFLVAGGLRTYDDVIAYLRSPFIFGWEIVFLCVVTYHALLGVRAILFDLGPGPRAVTWINRVLTAVGVVTVLYGVWLSAVIVGR